jgi:SAM-dependent methyltransferase
MKCKEHDGLGYNRWGAPDGNLLKGYIPNDHSRQVSSYYYVDYLIGKGYTIKTVMDLGCGIGSSVEYFRKIIPDLRWIGVDIEDSPEAKMRVRNDADFYSFDGVNIPFPDNSFDLIYSNQVFEHVRRPRKLLKEIYRVLKKEGFFVGSVSQLEPCHSYSVWNYTPYGFRLLVEDAELKLLELRPSIDAITLILWHGLGRPKCLSQWNRESLLNKLINFYGKITRKSNTYINAVKLLFCGQFCFLVRKP